MTEKSNNPKDRVGSSKVSLTRIPLSALIEMAKAGMYGNFMYEPFNWRDKDKKIAITIYLDAILRHAFKLMDGEEVDSDSGVSHWGHIAQTSAVAIDAIAMGNFVDDRPAKGKGPELLEKFMVEYPSLKEHWQKTKDSRAKQVVTTTEARDAIDDILEIWEGNSK